MFEKRLFDRARELYEVGSSREETTIQLNELRNSLIEEDRGLLLDAGYSERTVDEEMKDFDERLRHCSEEIVNDLYC